MNLKNLRIFASVLQLGSLKSAAELHAISESAASRQLKSLEQTLGLTLFERQVRQLVPTPAAIALNEELSRALVTLDGLPDFAQRLKEERKRVRLVAAVRTVRSLVAPVIKLQTERYPKLQIDLDVQAMRHARRWIAARRYDLAVGRGSVEHPELVRIPFCHVSPVVILPCSHPLAKVEGPITLEALQDLPFIAPTLDQSQLGQDIERLCQHHQLTLKPFLETVSTSAACALVEQQLGFTLTDQFGALGESNKALVARPLASDFRFEYAFYLHKADKHSTEVQQVIGLMREHAAQIL